MSAPGEEQDPVVGDVIVPQEDALPGPSQTGHGKMPENIDDDDFERAAEQERVAAGLSDYAPSDVPPATDPLPPEASEAADLAQRGLLEGGAEGGAEEV
ncbi:hypothetical protein QFZ65_000087 [Arthrobacter sp. B3I9]|uniref:hypothetical protein n=1 Tax=Arthrobacter sp. B3I9 TaxID=3042270 RepID=UPI00278DE397|nr:hypothetical protein [Arthrobacter sp. B3I9]MDQ0848149.1 hypothetical protein [Arthrobacter sp. B3I9]